MSVFGLNDVFLLHVSIGLPTSLGSPMTTRATWKPPGWNERFAHEPNGVRLRRFERADVSYFFAVDPRAQGAQGKE